MKILVEISANTEWKALLPLFPQADLQQHPYGAWFHTTLPGFEGETIFFHGGWGKIQAAASTQHMLDRFTPDLLVNLGTCGGFDGCVQRGTLLLVERTLVYDIIEQMGDFDEAIQALMTELDLTWLRSPYPRPVLRTLIVSGDRDLIPDDIERLKTRYGAVAGDWESGAIAFVCAHNQVRCLILRAVSDLVGEAGGEFYGKFDSFEDSTRAIMTGLVADLPDWLKRVDW